MSARKPHADRVAARAEAVKVAQRLRSQEHMSVEEIGVRLGRAPSTIRGYLYDPDGSTAKKVKARYRGTCKNCGRATSGGDGKGKARELCETCKGERYRKWDEDVIVAAMVRWHDEHGRLPTSTDLSITHARRRGTEHVRRLRSGTYPEPSRVIAVFGRFAAAREAAERTLRSRG